jgi:hypothetical protein
MFYFEGGGDRVNRHRKRESAGSVVAATVGAVMLLTGCAQEPRSSAPAGGPIDLSTAERQVFSQFGEDGVIEKIFEIIEPTTKYVVEFGAYDGVTGSNARNLVVNHGWSSYMIEGDPARAKQMVAAYKDYPSVVTQEAWVYPGNIEILFEDAKVPKDFDLLVIDIDSNDYYVWRAIHDYRPKVVMIEAHPNFPPPELMVIDFHPMNYWDGGDYGGASAQSMYNLAKKKGYELIYCMGGMSPNVFFVDAQYFERFGIADNSPVKLYPKRLHKPVSREFPEGKKFLTWENLKIEKKFLSNR